MGNDKGFSLVEVAMAVAIMAFTMTAIIRIKTNTIKMSGKTELMLTATMLAKNKMIETELAIEGKSLTEMREQEGGSFEKPFEKYKWKRLVKELKFPPLNVSGSGDNGSGGGGEGEAGSAASQTGLVARIVTNFLNKSIREIKVSVLWPYDGGEQEYSLTTYWIDLNHELSLTD